MNQYQPVMQQDFESVVNKTTAYLQQLMDRVGELEARVETLEKPKARAAQKKTEDSE